MSEAPLSSAPARTGALSKDDVVAAAAQIVLEGGVAALTMRRLSEALGVAVTSIYWHVGNREALLGLIVDRLLAELEAVKPRGAQPKQRIASLCRDWREALVGRPHLVGLAHHQHRTSTMFLPMTLALAEELAALGLRGEPAAFAVRSLQIHIVASLLLERTAGYDEQAEPLHWPQPLTDPALVAALETPPDYRAIFDAGLVAILATLPE